MTDYQTLKSLAAGAEDCLVRAPDAKDGSAAEAKLLLWQHKAKE